MILLISEDVLINFIAALLFLSASLTDIMDGYYARKYNIVTDLGKILDPLADKLMVLVALIMLIPLGRISAWIVSLIVLRETAVTSLRAVAASDGTVIAASPLGKYKNLFQVIATLFLIMHHNFPIISIKGVSLSLDFHSSGMVLMWVALILTLWSGFDYFLKFFMESEKAKNP
jgi:CDP-diacylglycerol--glycerol-3-phosphate 3-phosphatidyltransferase